MTESLNINLTQKRAGKVKEGDWLPNLGKVSKILISGDKVRFYFERSASREFETTDIVYCDQRNAQKPSKNFTVPSEANLQGRSRPQARKGVSIE